MHLSFGSIIIGLAATWLVFAYVVQPFRRKKAHSDRAVEAWIAEIRSDLPRSTAAESMPLDEPARHCPHCGRPVQDDHRFCPGCGAQLSSGPSE
jgi:uncharacterized protein (UPF0212 family)